LIIEQKLPLPASAAGACNANDSATSKKVLDNDRACTARQGDNFLLMVKDLGIEQAALQKANNIDNPNELRVGQRLIITTTTDVASDKSSSIKTRKDHALVLPSQTTSGNSYGVKSGDIIDKVAHDLEVEKADLRKRNNQGKPG
jgi:hypothetical protein